MTIAHPGAKPDDEPQTYIYTHKHTGTRFASSVNRKVSASTLGLGIFLGILLMV